MRKLVLVPLVLLVVMARFPTYAADRRMAASWSPDASPVPKVEMVRPTQGASTDSRGNAYQSPSPSSREHSTGITDDEPPQATPSSLARPPIVSGLLNASPGHLGPEVAGGGAGWVTGRLTDAITGLPLAGAQVEVQARIVDRLPNGTLRLRSMDQTISLGIAAYADGRGTFRVRVPCGQDPTYLKVVARGRLPRALERASQTSAQ